MKLEIASTVLRALPVQIIDYGGGVILKRGALETRVHGEGALDILKRVLDRAHEGATRDQIRDQFVALERPTVDALLDQLIERRILVACGAADNSIPQRETPEGIFYWEFEQDVETVRKRLRAVQLVIVGVNEISRELVRSLRRSGIEQCPVVDYPLLRNVRLFQPDGALLQENWQETAPIALEDWQKHADEASIDCVIGTCDYGGQHWLRYWNRFCMANRLQFLPVTLQNMIGYIGPHVVPGETACFECLRARQNSHLARPEEERALEPTAFDTQEVLGFHPAMPGAIAHVTAMELIKVFGRSLPFRRMGSLIELNLVIPKLTTRKVLRVPNCSVCRMIDEHSAISTDKGGGFMPGNAR